MKQRILSLLLAIVMVLSILPAPINAVDVETTADSDSVVGKFAKVTTFGYGEARQDPNYAGNMVTSDHYPELLVITGVAVVGSTTYYQLSAAEGYTWPAISNAVDGWYLESTKVVVLEACGICGKTGCTAIHFYCEICLKYDCGKDHLHCPACGEVDCTKTHTWCGLCGDYDCDIEHEDIAPNTVPIIPDNPTMTEGAEVSIVDEYGDPVTEEGFFLFEGTKSSLSAWSSVENASYQWQIRYDSGNDRWADIQGQRGKGILLSPAMVLSIIEDQGSTAVRCIVTAGDETLTSAAIPVEVLTPGTMAAFALGPGATEGDTSAAAEDDENKVNLIIHYVFTDGKIAANPWAASLPAGVAYSTTTPITVPTIAGYAPVVDESGNYQNATLDGYQLSLSFSAEELKNDCTVNIVYQPAPVKVIVEHYQQNVDNDNYTLVDTDELSLVTGTPVGNVHKDYDGFYSLLYEHPTVAADGSTLIQVYYDRYYYLMKFELDGGYGVDPIYARYGAPIEIGTPTRPGYSFAGWTLDGNPAAVMPTMPARNTTFVAVWSGEMTSYDVVFWYENADNSRYSQAGVLEDMGILAGSIVNGADHQDDAFAGRDDEHFTYFRADENVTINGDGSTVINVYFKRNLYTVTFVMGDTANGCTVPLHASHTDYTGACYTLSCDQYHVHTDDCNGTITCGKDAHTHTAECLKCDLPIHTEHTQDCLTCQIPVHTHSTHCCTVPVHAHTPSNCCSIPAHSHGEVCCVLEEHEHTYDRGGNWPNYIYYGGCYPDNGGRQPVCGYQEHEHSTGTWSSCTCEQEEHTHSNSYNYNFNSCNTECGFTAHDHSSGCVYCSENLTEHTHSESSNCYSDAIHAAHTEAAGCYSDTAHTHTDDCYSYSCGAVAHIHTEACYKLTCDHLHYHSGNTCYLKITRKYDADLTDVWKKNPVKGVIDNGYVFESNITGDYYSFLEKMPGYDLTMTKYDFNGSYKYTWYYYLEVLPGMDTTGLTTRTDGGRTYYLYHTSSVYASTLNLTYAEDYFPITGFTQRDSKVPSFSNRTAYLYYTRNKYNLSFSNHGMVVAGKGGDFYYQADISGQHFVPDYPSTLEPDVYRFEGWYTSPFFGNTKYEFTTTDEDGNVVKATMPAEAIRLYARWVPVSRTVRFYLDKVDMDAGVTIPERMDALWKENHGGQSNPNSPYVKFNTKTDVPNKSFLSEIDTPGVSDGYDNHPYKGFTFVGWFYMDDGVEKAFDPKNMPVTHDMDLYGKWSSNVLCPYEIRFVLDENGNGVLDASETTFIADPITGSTLAGNSRTFNAKGDTALYAGYQSGYYPNVASHTIDFKASDEGGVVFTFLYKKGDPVPYTVRYLEKGTNKVLADPVSDPDNTKAVVTENFKPISGYMPDAYQKTLVVVPGSDENVIIFYYTKDTEHALYQVNHYIENLGGGWTEYRSATFTGEIGKDYFASAETVTGFTFSDAFTNQYNTADKINAYTNTSLPGDVRFTAATDTVSGTLSANGMQLNLYYTRNAHTYKVQYLEFGTEKVLHPEKTAHAKYNQFISENAVRIEIDLDGDGKNEDFQLYEATKDPQTATIKDDSTILKFYYVRCTQDLTVTKKVIDEKPKDGDMPDPELSFDFLLTLHANDFHQDSYRYEIRKGDTVVSSGYKTVNDDGVNRPTLSFSLMDGEKITFFGLPTAEYTVSEQNIPLGYYDTYAPARDVKLTVDRQVDVTVTNTYAPAALEISKTVEVEEENTNTPEKESFEFTIQVPAGVTGSFPYTVAGVAHTATVTNGKMTISLKDGQRAVFPNLPVGKYTVAETDFRAFGYNSYVSINDGEQTESLTAEVELKRGTTNTVAYQNKFPVGDLQIEKTVTKEFYGIPWDGDTFTFTVKRTDEDRPLIENNQYYVEIDGIRLDTPAVVDSNGDLKVTITFNKEDAASLKSTRDSVAHTLVIKDLPTGTYAVTEAQNERYIQSDLTVSGLVIPADKAPTAEFTNKLIRPTGSLYLEKELVPAEGYNPSELPEGTEFTFTIELTEEPPQTATIQVTRSDGSAASVTMQSGRFDVKLQAGQSVVITGLPIGSYRITEATIPSYANNFAHRINGNWVEQPVTSTADGCMYTDILVFNAQQSDVLCTNTYPVNRAELIIQKLVTKAYDRDTLPGGSFAFTVTLEKEDVASYDYKVYDQSGAEIKTGSVTVTDKRFSISLEAGQYAIFDNMPVCGYTVSETANEDYRTSYALYQFETSERTSSNGQLIVTGDGTTITRTFIAGKTDKVVFTNEYKKHLGALTITKTVAGNPPTADTFVFHIYKGEGENMQKLMDVTIEGQGSITIYDLPLGTYTVTEDTSWNWRYTATDASETAVLTVDDPDTQVGFTNTYRESKWLNFFWNRLNEFAAVPKGDDV